jgi:hypothetical protein
MEANSKRGGKNNLGSVSSASLNQKRAISSAPRMLSPSEIESLRQDKRNTARVAGQFFKNKK